MNEFEILNKAYQRMEKLYTEKQVENIRLKKKVKKMVKDCKELNGLLDAHIRLNRKLAENIKELEKENKMLLKRQETGQISKQTNKKG